MRSIEEIEAVLTVMGVEMFYVQSSTGLWWAQVDERRSSWMDMYTDTAPLFTLSGRISSDNYHGLHKTKQEACNRALDKFIGETK